MSPYLERLTRWEKTRRDQFTSVANLLLGLATGLLAFQSTILLDGKLVKGCASGLALFSLLCLSVSIMCGLFCALNRLHDFRTTVDKIRADHKRIPETPENDESISAQELRTLGTISWVLLYTQVAAFIAGAVCGSVAVAIQILPCN